MSYIPSHFKVSFQLSRFDQEVKWLALIHLVLFSFAYIMFLNTEILWMVGHKMQFV